MCVYLRDWSAVIEIKDNNNLTRQMTAAGHPGTGLTVRDLMEEIKVRLYSLAEQLPPPVNASADHNEDSDDPEDSRNAVGFNIG